jgi:hypothetical protein
MMEVKFLNGPITWCPLIVEEIRDERASVGGDLPVRLEVA